MIDLEHFVSIICNNKTLIVQFSNWSTHWNALPVFETTKQIRLKNIIRYVSNLPLTCVLVFAFDFPKVKLVWGPVCLCVFSSRLRKKITKVGSIRNKQTNEKPACRSQTLRHYFQPSGNDLLFLYDWINRATSTRQKNYEFLNFSYFLAIKPRNISIIPKFKKRSYGFKFPFFEPEVYAYCHISPHCMQWFLYLCVCQKIIYLLKYKYVKTHLLK